MTAFGPWRPYTQTFTDNSFGQVLSSNQPVLTVPATITGTPTPNAVYNNSAARACCLSHVLNGAPMDQVGWVNGVSACPTTAPGTGAAPVGTGVVYRAADGFSAADYRVFGGMSFLNVIANLTPSIFHPALPFWADPDAHDTTDPPAFTIVGSRVIHHEYQPFTAIDVDVEVIAPLVAAADMAYTLRVKRGTYGTTPVWVLNGGPGIQIGTVAIAAGGAATATGSDHIPDATIGSRWTITSTSLQHGYFPGDDPGVPPWGGISSGGIASIWADPTFRLTVRRTGLRRSTGVAPPLHQRQRTDGLGGGPMHQSPGLASRQLGGRARGIY